ncbi:MAG: VOC family protein [Alphaproteobacteria bacterium]|nr:VOC family protein [Alphaproteobacteria bacterium]
MTRAYIEHVNISVSDPDAAAAMLIALFDWRERWRGPSQMGGRTIHVGDDQTYIAVYSSTAEVQPPKDHRKGAPLNHIALVVDDLDAIERKVEALGLKPFGHGDYEPGRRFYFFDRDGVEYEIVSYA